jgi:hypothetical protein
MNGHNDPQEYVIDVVNNPDASKGVYDTNNLAAPGLPYKQRKPLTPAEIQSFRPKKESK